MIHLSRPSSSLSKSIAAIGMTFVVSSGAAHAQGSGTPFVFSYGSQLLDASGEAVKGPLDVELKFFRQASGGDPLPVSKVVRSGVQISSDGVFQIDVNEFLAEELHSIFDGGKSTWVEVIAGGKAYPRQMMIAVPFAMKVPTDNKVVKFNGKGQLTLDVGDEPAANEFLTKTADGTWQWKTPEIMAAPAASISTKPVDTAAIPTSGQVLKYDGAQWKPQSILPNDSGQVNKYLFTDGAGTLSWGTPSGAGDITDVVAGTGLAGGAGSGSATLSLPNIGTPGTYAKVTTDAQGRVTAGTSLAVADIPSGIGRSSLASGNANHVLINDGAGAVSGEAQLAVSRGGTGASTANGALNTLLPTQTGNVGMFLKTDGTNTSWDSAITAAAGSNTQIQFNSGNAFAGSANLSWNDTTKSLELQGTNTDNMFVGVNTGLSNSTGYMNTFLGYRAGKLNTTGNNNTFVGNINGYSNTTGYQNTFVGSQAGNSNSSGLSNTAVGYAAGNANSTGSESTFVGRTAGQTSTADRNTFVGANSGNTVTSGGYNTFSGAFSGASITTGASNTLVGYAADSTLASVTGAIAIGRDSRANANNAVAIGNGIVVGTTDNIAIGTNATERIRIDASGKVGIGTTTPAGALHVDSAGSDTVLKLSNSGAGAGAKITLGNSVPDLKISNEMSNKKIIFSTNLSGLVSERMRISENGRVGIGEATPLATLVVKSLPSDAISGTVTTTAGNASVSGSGTNFTTDFVLGDSIRIGSNVYQVGTISSNTSMTLAATAASSESGVAAYRDKDLLAVKDAGGNARLIVERHGVAIKGQLRTKVRFDSGVTVNVNEDDHYLVVSYSSGSGPTVAMPTCDSSQSDRNIVIRSVVSGYTTTLGGGAGAYEGSIDTLIAGATVTLVCDSSVPIWRRF